MERTRHALAATAVVVVGLAAIATGTPAVHSPARDAAPAAASARSPDADAQLLAALEARIAAARALESATLAAVEQRLRAIYAVPNEDPLIALPAGNVQEAQALGELEAAMTRSDEALLSGFTYSLANLQTAQAELAQNAMRLMAERRLAAARRAALLARPTRATPPTPRIAARPGIGVPPVVASQHSLPGAVPIDPQTGRPYPVAGT
jgi:hypothetical protein